MSKVIISDKKLLQLIFLLVCSTIQLRILAYGSVDVMGLSRGDGAGGENFLEQRLKQALLMHSEQILKRGGGHWISPLCTVLKFKHQSVI